MNQEQEFQARIGRIEVLVQEIQDIADPVARGSAEELIQALLDLHGAGLERILAKVDESGEVGQAIIDDLTQDDLVANLLLLHDLHPVDFETRIGQALDKVRPYMQSHRGNVELLGVSDGVVRLRLQGSCHGCPSSEMTLKLAIEKEIYAAAPDVVAIEVEGVVQPRFSAPNGVIPLTQVNGKSNGTVEAAASWQSIADLASLLMTPGVVRTLDVDGSSLLFFQLGTDYYAYAPNCPACGQPLDNARLDGTALECPACGHHYDVQRAGRGIENPGAHLEPFPLLVEQGQVRVAMPA